MIEGCLASGWDDPVPASHHTLWFRGHTPLFLQEKKDYSAEMRWKYGDLLDYLAGLSTYAKLPNMKLTAMGTAHTISVIYPCSSWDIFLMNSSAATASVRF